MSQSNWPEQDRPYDQGGPPRRDQWSDQPPPPTGMSGGMKACLIIICVGGVCCLACCGIFGYFAYSIGSSIAKPTVSNDPAQINTARDEILKMTLPNGLAPKTLTKVDNMFFSATMVEYENPGHADLTMMQIRSKFFQGDQMTAPMREQFEQKRMTHIDVGPRQNAKVETKNIKIKGEEYPFTFTKTEGVAGTGKEKGPGGTAKEKGSKKVERETIFGALQQGNGLVLINIDFDDTYKEADFVKMLETIQ